MKRTILKAGCITIFSMVLFFACTHELPVAPVIDPVVVPPVSVTPVPPVSPPLITCSADTVYYMNVIQPLLISTCAMSGCHDAITKREGVDVTTYAGVRKLVTPGNATGSKLYSVINQTGNSRMPPPPAAAMSAAQIASIQKWINQGALNNVCNQCDTANFKFSTAVKPLFDNQCVGCHNAASMGGGIDLSGYAAVKTAVAGGRIYGAINWTAGYSAMPKGGAKLSDCQIRQIKKWIDAGTPNN